jgi:aryl-alcohol dehydrogenase-like predicted oxidoreductase
VKKWQNKIGLGTAQFGLNYGINNANGKITVEEAGRIVTLARLGGVDTIDTAAGYGDSERVLGGCGVKDFHVITKIEPKAQTPDTIRESLRNSLAFLQIDRLHGVLVHDSAGFFGSPDNWAQLCRLRDAGVVSKIGVSVYRPPELEALLRRGLAIDLVQVPYSVLDNRFKTLFPKLRDAGIEVHVRSLFLQGVFFMCQRSLPVHFAHLASRIERLKEISRQLCVPLSTVLLAIGVLDPAIDRVVIGVDSAAHLQQNLEAIGRCSVCTPALDELRELGLLDESILLPINWPKVAL